MSKYYILYNPVAGNGTGLEKSRKLEEILKGNEIEFRDSKSIEDYAAFLAGLSAEDKIVISGGDGTLNSFINVTDGLSYTQSIYYYATGSGNDFLNDLGTDKEGVAEITDYLKNLPTVEVKGQKYKFINGVGYGIDGYCCEVGDKLRETTTKPINYTGIAIKGLLFYFKPVNATIVVDGQTYEYKKVWLAPTMNGRFYGGGMMPTPHQDRLNPEHRVSVLVMFGSGKLKTLTVFPSIFKGEHLKHEEMCRELSGHDITVTFDRPCALQVDGETILDVTSYHVTTV